MKRLLLAVAILPLVSFGDYSEDLLSYLGLPSSAISYNVYIPDDSSSSFLESGESYRGSPSGLFSYMSSVTFGLSVYPDGYIRQPVLQNRTLSTFSFDRPCSASSYTNLCFGLYYFPSVASLYRFACSVFASGYRGNGLQVVYTPSNHSYYNFQFNFSAFFNDVFYGTNSLYKSLLLNYFSQINNSLSGINTSINNINVDLGQFQSDYSLVNASHFDVSNVIDTAVSDSVIPSRLGTSLKSLARDPSNYDYIHSVLDSYRRAQWLPLAFSGSDLASPLHNDSRVQQGLKNLGDSLGAGASYHYTTPLTNELQKLNTNWVSEAKAALSNNTQQITNQLAHIFDDTPNGIGRVMRDTANNTLSASYAAGSIDERLQRGITVSVVNEGNTSVGVHLDGPVNIDTTQWQTLSTPLGGLRDTVSAMWDGFYQFYNMGSSNYDWSHFFDMVQAFKEQNHIDLAAISSQSVTGDVGRIYDYLSGYQSNILYQIATSTNSLDWSPWFDKWDPFTDIVTNYYLEFNASVPSSDIAADFLESGFDSDRYSSLPWFQRVEVLLAMIADVRSNSVEVADIQEDMEQQAEDFRSLSTNVVGISENVFGLFQYVQRFSNSLQSVFGDRAAPLTGDYVLLPAGSWIFDHPLTLRINPTIQNFCRLIMQCIWYLGFLVLLWVVVNWTWQKVVAVLRWLWSMFDV